MAASVQVHVRGTSGNTASEAHTVQRDTWSEAALPLKAPAGCHISLRDYLDYRKYLIGQKVKPARFSQEELEKAGYTCWKQYQLHCSLGNH